MKKNIIRLLVVIALAAAWLSYFHWNNQKIRYGRKVQHINCVNNLMQIGLTFRLWSGDHLSKYPCNVSTNDGGAMELVEADKDGFDTHAVWYLKNMGGEDGLGPTKILVCPQDSRKKPATNWNELREENITYRFQAGTKIYPGNQKAILAVCPVDGNILYCDGWVTDKNGNLPAGEEHSAHVRAEVK